MEYLVLALDSIQQKNYTLSLLVIDLAASTNFFIFVDVYGNTGNFINKNISTR
jgi:hypothetical protein